MRRGNPRASCETLCANRINTMSKVEFCNHSIVVAKHTASSRSGELMLQKRIKIRGKGKKESRKESYDAIFTFNESLFCSINEIPLDSGYFLTDDNQAEVTQLIGRFNSETERKGWIASVFKLTDEKST